MMHLPVKDNLLSLRIQLLIYTDIEISRCVYRADINLIMNLPVKDN